MIYIIVNEPYNIYVMSLTVLYINMQVEEETKKDKKDK